MMAYLTFATKREALAEIEHMRGWEAKPVKVKVYSMSGKLVSKWAIQCNGDLYLRRDGYVR